MCFTVHVRNIRIVANYSIKDKKVALNIFCVLWNLQISVSFIICLLVHEEIELQRTKADCMDCMFFILHKKCIIFLSNNFFMIG